MDLLVIRDALAIIVVVFSLIILFRDLKIKKENKELKDRLLFVEEDNVKLASKVDYYDNEYIPEMKDQLEKAGQEVTRLAALKIERDVDYLIKGIEYIISEKTKQGKQQSDYCDSE